MQKFANCDSKIEIHIILRPLSIVRLAVSKKRSAWHFTYHDYLPLARKMARPAFAEIPFWAFRDPSNAIAPNAEPHSNRAVNVFHFWPSTGSLVSVRASPHGTTEASFETLRIFYLSGSFFLQGRTMKLEAHNKFLSCHKSVLSCYRESVLLPTHMKSVLLLLNLL